MERCLFMTVISYRLRRCKGSLGRGGLSDLFNHLMRIVIVEQPLALTRSANHYHLMLNTAFQGTGQIVYLICLLLTKQWADHLSTDCTLYTVHLLTTHCTLYISSLHTVHCTSAHCTLYTVHLLTAHCTLCICSLHTVHCISAHCRRRTAHLIHYTLHTAHYTLHISHMLKTKY